MMKTIDVRMATLVLAIGAGLLGTGCVAQTGDDEESDAQTTDALTPTNHWIACSYGQVIDSFGGQAVRCDHPGDSGTYQCVEFANRYEEHVKNHKALTGNATDLCHSAANTSGYSVWDPHGTWGHKSQGHKPGPGDLLVWGGGSGGFGHVAVVTSSASAPGDVSYVQQNWGWTQNGKWGQVAHSQTVWHTSTSFFGAPGASGSSSHYPKCWIHPN
jgi:hypothetical protein